jgi:hypothetical protein
LLARRPAFDVNLVTGSEKSISYVLSLPLAHIVMNFENELLENKARVRLAKNAKNIYIIRRVIINFTQKMFLCYRLH